MFGLNFSNVWINLDFRFLLHDSTCSAGVVAFADPSRPLVRCSGVYDPVLQLCVCFLSKTVFIWGFSPLELQGWLCALFVHTSRIPTVGECGSMPELRLLLLSLAVLVPACVQMEGSCSNWTRAPGSGQESRTVSEMGAECVLLVGAFQSSQPHSWGRGRFSFCRIKVESALSAIMAQHYQLQVGGAKPDL